MKKLLVGMVVLTFVSTSCKKDRVCKCTVPANGTVTEQKYTYELDDTKKKNAKNSCEIANDHWALSGGKCELEK